eukprot:2545544-Rhodomonas_salina.2
MDIAPDEPLQLMANSPLQDLLRVQRRRVRVLLHFVDPKMNAEKLRPSHRMAQSSVAMMVKLPVQDSICANVYLQGLGLVRGQRPPEAGPPEVRPALAFLGG